MIDEILLRQAIAGNLRRLRKQINISQERLSERSGVSRTNLARIETLRGTPSASTLYALADALGVPTDALRQIPNTIPAKS